MSPGLAESDLGRLARAASARQDGRTAGCRGSLSHHRPGAVRRRGLAHLAMFVKPASLRFVARTIVLIPARLASTRLPDKPLAEIGGVPMIVQVWRRACEAEVGPVVVACAEAAIAEAVSGAGGEAVLTDPGAAVRHRSDLRGAAARLDPERRFERVINLQGDLPTLEPAAIRAVLEPLERLGTDIGTLAIATEDPEEKADPNVVKAVIAFDRERPRLGRALYFTRATAPSGAGPGLPPHRHLRLPPQRAGALRGPAAQPARAARAARAAARAGERHEHRRGARRHGSVRRRHSGRPGAGAGDVRRTGQAAPTAIEPDAMDQTADASTARARRRTSAPRIAFQGLPGAYSHLACRQVCPSCEALPATPSRTRSPPCARARPSAR